MKERLVGAAVLVATAVIFIPIILTDSPKPEPGTIQAPNIPEKPETNFNSRIIPVLEVDEKASSTPIDTNGIQSEGKQVENKQNTMQEIVVEKVISATDKSSVEESNGEEGNVKKEDGVKNNVGLSVWVIQLGSFSSGENAQSLSEKLRKAGYPAFVEPLKKNGQISYRVRIGPEIKRSDAESLLKILKDKMDLDGIIVNYP